MRACAVLRMLVLKRLQEPLSKVLACYHGRRFNASQVAKKNIVGLTKEELQGEFKKLDLEAFRADQGI